MSLLPSLTDEHVQPISLEQELASGGEGVVYTLRGDPSQVAKVYRRPPNSQVIEKLETLVRLANPRLLKISAWPNRLLYHARTRQLAGFMMPRLVDCQPIQHLYNPVQRLRFFPRACWGFQLRAAQNLAAAFDEVHKAGCLVGDVNERNVQVSSRALVRLIDCDSFQVRVSDRQFLCEVGVAHYTPPELQGKSLAGLVRTENHDRFGLAVLIYQLLFVGRHPYAGIFRGKDDLSFERLIAEFRFSQGPGARSWDMEPPPHTPTLADIPPELGSLYRRAFERGSETGTRPRPAEWLASLRRLEQSLAECDADPGHKYWRGSPSCVWCRLAARGAPEYYLGVAGNGGAFAVNVERLEECQRELSAIKLVDYSYDRDRFSGCRAEKPAPFSGSGIRHRIMTVVLVFALVLSVIGLPFGLVHGGTFVAGFVGALIFSTWLTAHIVLSPWQREHRRRKASRNYALHELEELEDEWSQINLRYHQAHLQASRSVLALISQCRGLGPRFQDELLRIAANAEAAARVRHLSLHLIAGAQIADIGEVRKGILASNGIVTAADIEKSRILRVSGFGASLASKLLAWKDEVLLRFRFDPISAVSAADQRSLAAKFRVEQNKVLAQLSRQVSELKSLASAYRAELEKLVPRLKRAVARYEQAEADIRLLYRMRKRFM